MALENTHGKIKRILFFLGIKGIIKRSSSS